MKELSDLEKLQLPGPDPEARGAWEPLLAAVGGVSALGALLGVPYRTVARWRSGEDQPSKAHVEQLRELASRKGVRAPL